MNITQLLIGNSKILHVNIQFFRIAYQLYIETCGGLKSFAVYVRFENRKNLSVATNQKKQKGFHRFKKRESLCFQFLYLFETTKYFRVILMQPVHFSQPQTLE